MSQLETEFLAYQDVHCERVEPLLFWRMHVQDWPALSRFALNLLAFPISSANVERVFSMFRIVSPQYWLANECVSPYVTLCLRVW